MSRYPVKSPRRAVRKAPVASLEPVERWSPGSLPSFRYSRAEIAAHDGAARVRSSTTRLEGGRLTHETLEGELSTAAYRALLEQSQRLFLTQAALMLGWLSALLPASRKGSARD